MSINNLSWKQIVVFAMLLAAVIGTYKLFGEVPASIALVIQSVVTFLLGRSETAPE